MDYDKLIIVDFDDTLCLHQGEDKSNIMEGLPNKPLIDKLNELCERGYRIEVFTARGHISCTNREEAELTFKSTIIRWLIKHECHFDHISFNKPYGIMYIDDKAVRPDELDLISSLT